MKIVPITDAIQQDMLDSLRLVDISQMDWFTHCCHETKDNGIVLLAISEEKPVGYVVILTKASYPSFDKQNIPEIHGMYVLPSMRRKGIARSLLQAAEQWARKQGFASIGLGVGVTTDYQPALQLYVRSGYIPDGNGLYHATLPNEYASHGDTITIDNSTTLWFIKTLNT